MKHLYRPIRFLTAAILVVTAILKTMSDYSAEGYWLAPEAYRVVALIELLVAATLVVAKPRVVSCIALFMVLVCLTAIALSLAMPAKRCGCLGAEARLDRYGGALLASVAGLFSTLLGYTAHLHLASGRTD